MSKKMPSSYIRANRGFAFLPLIILVTLGILTFAYITFINRKPSDDLLLQVEPSDNVDASTSKSAFDSRKDVWISALTSFFAVDSDNASPGVMLLEQAKRTGNMSRVKEANDRLVAAARTIDDPDWQGSKRPVYEGYAIDFLRAYMLFKDRPDLLYPSTVQKFLEGTEPSGSGFASNKNESFRFFFPMVTYSKARNIGLGAYNPWDVHGEGTENHKLQEIATGLILSQIYANESYSAPDGTFKMKDNTDTVDDYWHYWKAAFYTWLSKYGNKNGTLPERHLSWGVGEKDSANYLNTFLGDLWLIRDFVEDSTTVKYAEIYIDLLLTDFAEDELNGLYTGAKIRSNDYYFSSYQQNGGPRSYRTAILSHLLFGNLGYTVSTAMSSNLCNWGCWAYTAVATSPYNPTNSNFPEAIVSLALNKESGYLVREAESLAGPSAYQPKTNWVTNDYALGFTVGNGCGGDDSCGGLYINDARGMDGGSLVVPFIGDDPDYRYNPDSSGRAVVGKGVAINYVVEADPVKTPTELPTKLWIRNGFKEVDYSRSPWIFLRSSTKSNKEIFAAVRPVFGTHSSGGTVDKGEIRILSDATGLLLWDVSDSSKFSSFSDYKTAVLAANFSTTWPYVAFTGTSGDKLEYNRSDNKSHKINGSTVDLESFKYGFNNPYATWKFGTLEGSINKQGRTASWDFDGNNDKTYDDPIKRVNNGSGTSTLTPTPSPTLVTTITPTSTPILTPTVAVTLTPTPQTSPIPTVLTGDSTLILELKVFDANRASSWRTLKNVQSGNQQYDDRNYKFTYLPTIIQGSDWIYSTASSKDYASSPLMTFKVGRDSSVYVAYDDRVSSKPSWLSGWTSTGQSIKSDAPGLTQMSIYSKDFRSNELVALGTNSDTTQLLYNVFVKERVTSSPNEKTFEFENGSLSGSGSIDADTSASGGKYVTFTSLGGSDVFTINIDVSGDYYLWIRTSYPDVSSNSVSFKYDSSPTFSIGFPTTYNTWLWNKSSLKNDSTGTYQSKINLSSGSHTFNFIKREPNVKLDKFIITTDPGFVPN